jgi:hypothetical protein
MRKIAIVFLAVLLTTGYASASILYTQSFEDPSWQVPSQYYIDAGDPIFDHDLVNNVGQPWVDGPGFDATWINSRNDVGLTDGDYVGVTAYTGNVGAFTDGVQGYEFSDCDGVMVLTFDNFPTAQAVSIDLFVVESSYEDDDAIIITFGSTTILNTTGSDIDTLGIEGYWMTYSTPVIGGNLVISLESNSASEAIFIDNIIIADDLTIPNEDTTWNGVKTLFR